MSNPEQAYSNISHLKQSELPQFAYIGKIARQFFYKGNIALEKIDYHGREKKANSPEFKIIGKNSEGEFEFGTAWKKHSDTTKEDFLSLTFQHTGMDKPVYAAAYLSKNPLFDFEINFDRRKKVVAENAPSAGGSF